MLQKVNTDIQPIIAEDPIRSKLFKTVNDTMNKILSANNVIEIKSTPIIKHIGVEEALKELNNIKQP